MVDSVRVFDPGFRITDSEGAPMSGAKIKFYNAGTTNARTVYSDKDLSSTLGTIVYTGSDGAPVASSGSSTEVMVYTGTTAFKVVITDSSDVELMTFDNIAGALDTSLFLTTSSTSTLSIPVVTKTSSYTVVTGDRGKLINANPTGGTFTLTMTSATTLGDGWNVKIRNSGTANSVIISTSQTIAYAGITTTSLTLAVGEAVELVCDAAGFNVANLTPFPVIPAPQGYLTPTSATPAITGDVSAATAVYYTPDTGNLIPIWNGVRFMPTVFSELTLTLVSSHSSSSIYDVFVFSNAGTLTIVTGPVWSTLTAGSSARGTGAGTTQLTRVQGYWTNAVSMTGRNGSTTYSIDAGYATYVGSILTDSSAGQVTCHRAWGQSRKWGIWNAYNKREIILKCGDSTSSWTYGSGTVRQARADSANTIAVFCGLADDPIDILHSQRCHVSSSSNSTSSASIGVGWNSTSAASGRVGFVRTTDSTVSGGDGGGDAVARFVQVPSLGLNNVNAVESAPNVGASQTFFGGEDDMLLTVRYRG